MTKDNEELLKRIDKLEERLNRVQCPRCHNFAMKIIVRDCKEALCPYDRNIKLGLS